MSGHGYFPDDLIDLLRRPGSKPSASPQGEKAQVPAFDPPAMPRGNGARAVAEELVRDPAVDFTVGEWAARVLSSPRTLRRNFLADTGLPFEQWRLRCRLSAAVELLVAGYGVDQVTVRVGFASRNGFTRAFKQQFGLTHHELKWKLAARPVDGDPSQRATVARQADGLMQIVREDPGAVAAPGLLPARAPPRTPTTCMCSAGCIAAAGTCASATAAMNDYEGSRPGFRLTWSTSRVFARTPSRFRSNVTTADLRLTEPLQVQFSPAWDDYLMFCFVSARSRLRPNDYDPTHILDLFREQVAAQRALSVPMPTDPRAREVAMLYLRRVGASSESPVSDMSADVRRALHTETGMTFASWCYAARMGIARDLLAGGAKPSAVSRRVGYAHLPNFSAAFSRFHGLSPREYQERETENA